MEKIIRKEWLEQFFKFGLVGILNNIIYLGIYYCLIYFGINYIIANGIAFFTSVLNAYYCNKKFVFKDASSSLKPLIKTYATYGITFGISTLLLLLMVEQLGISTYIAPIINLTITIPMNFLLNKFWTFRK